MVFKCTFTAGLPCHCIWASLWTSVKKYGSLLLRTRTCGTYVLGVCYNWRGIYEFSSRLNFVFDIVRISYVAQIRLINSIAIQGFIFRLAQSDPSSFLGYLKGPKLALNRLCNRSIIILYLIYAHHQNMNDLCWQGGCTCSRGTSIMSIHIYVMYGCLSSQPPWVNTSHLICRPNASLH